MAHLRTSHKTRLESLDLLELFGGSNDQYLVPGANVR
jgi:hypothetical protein